MLLQHTSNEALLRRRKQRNEWKHEKLETKVRWGNDGTRKATTYNEKTTQKREHTWPLSGL